MNAFTKNVVLGAAGMLILQLAVVTSAQQTLPWPASAPGFSAPPAGKSAAAESSQSQGLSGAGGPTSGAITQPRKADGMGDPALGGERHPLYRLSKSDMVEVNAVLSRLGRDVGISAYFCRSSYALWFL